MSRTSFINQLSYTKCNNSLCISQNTVHVCTMDYNEML